MIKKLSKLVNIITYGAKCLTAISAGIKSALENWPTDNPFSNNDNPVGDEQK